MSIRFAAPTTPGRLPAQSNQARAIVRRAIALAANDNGTDETNDRLLRAALEHFAEHGLGAARAARTRAEHAFFADDRKNYEWWIGVTRTLDRSIASDFERQIDLKKRF